MQPNSSITRVSKSRWRLLRVVTIFGMVSAIQVVGASAEETPARTAAAPFSGQSPTVLPTLDFPDPRIAEVFLANWQNTLKPCQENVVPHQAQSPHVEPLRPWKVDVNGHYPGWYPGVDVKHMAAAYLACTNDLPLVLRAWDLTSQNYQQPDGAVQPSTMKDNPQSVWPETTVDKSVIFYPLRTTATIDYLLLGDLIFRYSQDRQWLAANLRRMHRAVDFLSGWVDPDGLLHSDSYDLDQAYREIDGVAHASACLALGRLAELERVAGSPEGERRARGLARRLAQAAALFWDTHSGYFAEHLVYENEARREGLTATATASSELDADHAASLAIDGIAGIGIDAFQVGLGSAGRHEWAARDEGAGAWLQIDFSEPTTVSGAILLNRTDLAVGAGDRFATGRLEFSDGSEPVLVEFNKLAVSRASVRFSPRLVNRIRFQGLSTQDDGGRSAGLAEFRVLAARRTHRLVSHGMTDTNFAMVGFGVANQQQSADVWQSFQSRQSRFYEVNGVRAPTWISEKAESYKQSELNRRAPYKDCVAMGRTWRYDALMRQRMRDGEGLYETIRDAIGLFDRPSGGGVGLFAERYGLGKFQPGDESQANVPAYSEYPAVFASTVVTECLLGISVGADGRIQINPCVPADWYQAGFGQAGCGFLMHHHFAFRYQGDLFRGTLSGPSGTQTMRVRVPPSASDTQRIVPIEVFVNDTAVDTVRDGDFCQFTVPLDGLTASEIRIAVRGQD